MTQVALGAQGLTGLLPLPHCPPQSQDGLDQNRDPDSADPPGLLSQSGAAPDTQDPTEAHLQGDKAWARKEELGELGVREGGLPGGGGVLYS